MSPLTDLLRGLQKKKEKLAWSAQADEAFERIKQAMASAVRSAFYHPGQPLALHTDASNTAIGAALSQRHADDDDWTPLGFFSQKLSPTQQRYSTYDRELLAIFEAIKYFQRILEGRSFTIMTDHRPLSFALEQKSDKFSPRQSRQLDFISRFDAKIVYTPGDENPVADALSRIDAITMPTTLNSAQISAEQQKDEQLTHLRGKAKLKLHDVVIDGLSLVCVEQRDGLKPYLPESLRRQAFDTAHTLSHPSGRATVKRVALLYFWPSMSKDIVRWAKQCVPCQQSKVHRHNRAELGNFVTPDGRFDHVHIDIVKMPLHQGFQNCLTMIDRYTRWPQAIPIGDIARPRHRGLSHFQASSSAYELPSKRTCKRRQRRWFSARRYAYPGSSSHDKKPDKTSPSEFVSALRRLFQAIRPVPASRHVQHRPFVFKDLATSDYVFRRLDTILKPLEQPYTGPHRVIRRINERNFVVDRKVACAARRTAGTNLRASESTRIHVERRPCASGSCRRLYQRRVDTSQECRDNRECEPSENMEIVFECRDAKPNINLLAVKKFDDDSPNYSQNITNSNDYKMQNIIKTETVRESVTRGL
ncbi:unnamed protein product [Trichogramma brassicae]|uniref:RNA-directed DNA polymerase n=1 Tax=Trichogramma brassicae TaxID=86971 RepID=A0A6H5HXF9_9HYME|nr:unnamed protein product [Trichogramma brassicae]